MKKQSGFTAIELIIAIIVLVTAGVVVLVQNNNLNAQHRDVERKTAINAIYYNLEEVVYPSLGGYPLKLDASLLKAMDSTLLKDPQGTSIGTAGSNYSYEPSSCDSTICKHYVLQSTLEREATFKKQSRH